jgi:S1-C subfamily serine protease
MSNYTGPVAANFFQAGSTCPFCQEAITEGQMVVTCLACGSLHHDTCWQHRGGCSSYHCDDRVKADASGRPAEIVITPTEAARATVPPKPVRPGAQDAARPFLPKEPTRLSRLAVVSAVLGGASLLGLWGALAGESSLTILALTVALAAIVVAVIALVLINTGRSVYGSAPAAVAIAVAAAMAVRNHSNWVNYQIAKNRPTEAELARLGPAKARAMRANVVITSSAASGFSGEIATGSGIIVKLDNHKAWILTNRHVVGEPGSHSTANRSITVLFYNGESSPATVDWVGPGSVDLALVSCEALTLDKAEPVELLADAVPQGTPVFAIGNPEGLSWTYTEGVISGVRIQEGDGENVEAYQTQTPVNSGSSGGGLYGMDGKLVGVNSWTYDKAVSEGLSFAISTRSILKFLGEENVRRFLTPAPLPPATAEMPPPSAPAKPSATSAEDRRP